MPESGAGGTITRVVDGGTVVQTWRYPGRAECISCHNGRRVFAQLQLRPGLNRDVQ